MKKKLLLFLVVTVVLIITSCTKQAPKKYKVSFDTDGGSPVTAITVNEGSIIDEPKTTKEGFVVNGWYKDKEFKEKWNFEKDKVKSNLVLYVLWEEVINEISIAELTEQLLTSPYVNPDLDGNYGLNDPSIVGVVEQDIVELYSAKPDANFLPENIFDFESIKTEEKLENDTVTWDYIISQVKETRVTSSKDIKIKLPNREIEIIASASATSSGVYSISINGINNLYVEGGKNTVLLIDTPESWKGGLLINNSENVQINNVHIDYKYSPTLAGTITDYSKEDLTITIEVPEELHETVVKYLDGSDLGSTLHSFIEYSVFTNAPKEKGNILIRNEGMFEDVTIINNGGESLDKIIVKFNEGYRTSFKTPRINDKVALGFAMYGNNGIGVQNSKNIYIESSGIYTAPGMGLVASNSENIYINKFEIKLIKERLMTTTADGMHLVHMLGDVKVTNSIIENTHDDALNIKSGYYYSLSSTDAQTKTLTLSRKTSSTPLPRVGDIIEIYGADDFDFRDRFTVVSVTGTEALMKVVVKERIAGSIDWTNAVATNVSFSPKFVFKNNIVRNKRNRGILVQVRDALIENNYFENVGHGSISVHSSLDIFNEATMPDNTIIRNNKLINNGYLLLDALRGDISVYAIAAGGKVAPPETIKNLYIFNNFIANNANTAISLRGVGGDNVSLENNLFYNSSRLYSSNLTEGAIELVNVTNIVIKGNYNYYTLGSDTFSGIIPAGLTKTSTISLEGNTNLHYQTIEGEVQSIVVKKVDDNNITIDGDVSEWLEKGTDIEIIGSSLATGDEILNSEFNSYFEILMAKIAYSDTGIYFAFDIKDDKLEFKTIHDFWTGDIIEIFLSTYIESPNADFMLFKEEGNVFQAAFAPTWETNFYLAPSRTNSEIVNSKNLWNVSFKTNDHGYQGEIYIPFTVIPEVKSMADSGEGVPIAIVIADGDRDEINRKRIQAGNVPHFVEAFKTKTVRMPLYIFSDTNN